MVNFRTKDKQVFQTHFFVLGPLMLLDILFLISKTINLK